MKSLKEIIQNLEKLKEYEKEVGQEYMNLAQLGGRQNIYSFYEQGGLNLVMEETLEYLLSESIMAEELFTALSDLVACDGDFSHIKMNGVDLNGLFDLLTDGESYNKAVNILKKSHLSVEGNRPCDEKEKT